MMGLELKRGSKDVLCKVICYPKCEDETFNRRLKELKELGIIRLIPKGRTKINGFRVLGKGCVSVVVLAEDADGNLRAVKIRRTDADRKDLLSEAKALSMVNKLGVGPKLYGFKPDILVMEYLDGLGIGEWLVRNRYNSALIRRVLKDLLSQCYRMDKVGIVHKELSSPEGHVIIDRREGRPYVVDFETVSYRSSKRNLTQIMSYLLFREGPVSEVVKRALSISDEDVKKVRELLKKYKFGDMDRAFESLLKILNLTLPEDHL